MQQDRVLLWGTEANDSTLRRILSGQDSSYLTDEFSSKSFDLNKNSLRLSYKQVKDYLPYGVNDSLDNYAKDICIYLTTAKRVNNNQILALYVIDDLPGRHSVLASYLDGKLADVMAFLISSPQRYSLAWYGATECFQVASSACRFIKSDQFVRSYKNVIIEENKKTHQRDTIQNESGEDTYIIDSKGKFTKQ